MCFSTILSPSQDHAHQSTLPPAAPVGTCSYCLQCTVVHSCSTPIHTPPPLCGRKGVIRTAENVREFWFSCSFLDPEPDNVWPEEERGYFRCKPSHGLFVKPEKATHRGTVQRSTPADLKKSVDPVLCRAFVRCDVIIKPSARMREGYGIYVCLSVCSRSSCFSVR